MSNTLLPCPFCGGEAAECDIKQLFANGWVGCQRCRCFMDFVKNGKPLAIAAWNRRAEPVNKPLTLDELKQMGGEPVWVVTLDGTDDSRWEIVVSAGKCGIDLICVLNGVETSDYAAFDLYNDTWLAYRNKPVKEEHYEDD